MQSRALILLRARLSGSRADNLPVAPLILHGLIATALAWIARTPLPPFAYATYMLTTSAVLVALPLLGEFSHLLRADSAEEWVGSLPATKRDVRLARAMHVGVVLAWLAMGSLVPATLLAPVGLGAKVLLLVMGLGLVGTIAGALFGVQAILGERAEALLVATQTLLFAGAILGFVLGANAFGALSELSHLGAAGWTWSWPPAWFAAPLGAVTDGGGSGAIAFAVPLAATLAGLAAMIYFPAAPRTRHIGETAFSRMLAPLRALSVKTWVKRDERAAFDLVFDALPLEREVVLRTYPLVGVPIAFVVIGASDADPVARMDLLAILFFTACIYLPVLLMHVPASASHRARWILDTHPIDPGVLANGVIKALTLRFLVPLYVALGGIAWAQAGPGVLLRFALPGLLVSLLVLRMIYRSTVHDLPLSVPPDEVETKYDWGGVLMGIGLGLTIVAVLVNRKLTEVHHGLLLIAGLVVLELLADRATRSGNRAPAEVGADEPHHP